MYVEGELEVVGCCCNAVGGTGVACSATTGRGRRNNSTVKDGWMEERGTDLLQPAAAPIYRQLLCML